MMMMMMVIMICNNGENDDYGNQQFLCPLSNMSHLGGWMVIIDMMKMVMMVVKIMMEHTCP